MAIIQRVSHHKTRIIIFACCVGVAGVFVFYIAGLYPIAVVNGHGIIQRQLHIRSTAAVFYYKNLLKAYNQESEDPKMHEAELEPEVLNGIIEDELIAEKLSADLGEELQYLLTEKLAIAGDSPDLEKNAVMAYGMRWSDFRKEILIPQAMKDILADQFFLKKENADEWLDRAKKSANVVLLSSKFKWDGSNVAFR